MRPEHLDTLLKPSENKANLEHFLTYSLSLLSFICRGVCSTTRVARICISFRNGFWRENEKKTLQEDVNQGWQTPAQSFEAAEWEWPTHGCCCWCLVTKLCQSLCKSMTVAHQAPLSMGRILAWVAISFFISSTHGRMLKRVEVFSFLGNLHFSRSQTVKPKK